MIRATIIIPTKDKLSRLRLVLKTLEHQVDNDIEVIVVFDGCSEVVLDEYKDIRLTYVPVVIVHKISLGRAMARNAGIRKARGAVIIFLDDDRIPGFGFVEKHIQLHSNGRLAVLGKRYNVNYSEEKLRELYSKGMDRSDFIELCKFSRPDKYDWLKRILSKLSGNLIDSVTFTTGNTSVKKDELVSIGMFDEKFKGWGVEDIDLGYRLVKNGVKVKRDSSIANFHLEHRVNHRNQKMEYWKNFNYFAGKIRQDKFSLFLARLINLFSPYT